MTINAITKFEKAKETKPVKQTEIEYNNTVSLDKIFPTLKDDQTKQHLLSQQFDSESLEIDLKEEDESIMSGYLIIQNKENILKNCKNHIKVLFMYI